MTTPPLTTSSGYTLNAVADSHDIRDLIYEPALIPVKDEWLPTDNPNILDQGREGACTGFGLAAALNQLDIRRQQEIGCKPRGPVSARMLYEMARKFDEWPGEDYSGSSCRGAIRGWQNMGVCPDEAWEYEADNPGHLSKNRAVAARSHKPGAYYRLQPRLSDYHTAINEAGVIYASAQLHSGWNAVGKDGDIPYRAEKTGGHAFAIVGYTAEGFWIQNSWSKRWGKSGLALWRYNDWQENIRDAWVVRLAASTPEFSDGNQGVAGGQGPAQLGKRKTRREEIAGHFVHIDDGGFDNAGAYFTDLQDIQETASYLAEQQKYQHLLLYAHGGLNSAKDSANRIAAMKNVFKANGIYPFHFMYDTGLMEELKDVIFRQDEGKGRAAGIADRWDRGIERLTRVPGRALWREMKRGARSPFHKTGAGAQTLQTLLGALPANMNIHLAGHSTGAVLMGYLLKYLTAELPERRIATCSLMAPACTIRDFNNYYAPGLAAPPSQFGIDAMTVFNLNDKREQDDTVAKIYRKSLLYLVSRAFEEKRKTPLLGMELYSGGLSDQNLEIVYSAGKRGPDAVTASKSHGGFDNDPATLNTLLMRVLGVAAPPTMRFTKNILDY